jgi:hypothetical protein
MSFLKMSKEESEKNDLAFKSIYELLDRLKLEVPILGYRLSDILDSASTGGEWMDAFKYCLPKISQVTVSRKTWDLIQKVLSGFKTI